MTVLFEPNGNLLLLEIPEKSSDAPQLHLPDKLKKEKLMKETFTFNVVASHPRNDYKVGDKIMLMGETANNLVERIFPTTEGDKSFFLIEESIIMGKVTENVTI